MGLDSIVALTRAEGKHSSLRLRCVSYKNAWRNFIRTTVFACNASDDGNGDDKDDK